jgi:hypothetical protein
LGRAERRQGRRAACVESALVSATTGSFRLPETILVALTVLCNRSDGPVGPGQANAQVPFVEVSPKVRSRRRFNAATRWWSHALFLTTPR